GLRYNQFHTTALCSPTRTTLLTGRNHHMNNMGGITEVATAFPGNTGVRPNAIAPLAEILPDEARADFAAISDDLDFIKSQLSRQPDRAWLSRMGLIGLRQCMGAAGGRRVAAGALEQPRPRPPAIRDWRSSPKSITGGSRPRDRRNYHARTLCRECGG